LPAGIIKSEKETTMFKDDGQMTKQEVRDWFWHEAMDKPCWGKKYQAYILAIEILDKSLEADRVAQAAFEAIMREKVDA